MHVLVRLWRPGWRIGPLLMWLLNTAQETTVFFAPLSSVRCISWHKKLPLFLYYNPTIIFCFCFCLTSAVSWITVTRLYCLASKSNAQLRSTGFCHRWWCTSLLTQLLVEHENIQHSYSLKPLLNEPSFNSVQICTSLSHWDRYLQSLPAKIINWAN